MAYSNLLILVYVNPSQPSIVCSVHANAKTPACLKIATIFIQQFHIFILIINFAIGEICAIVPIKVVVTITAWSRRSFPIPG